MQLKHKLVLAVFPAVAVILAALHAPGQMSVDSVAALYEGATGQAAGWGPTFFSAFLAWLGKDVVGSSLFVAINCFAIYGCMAALLASRTENVVPVWQQVLAWLLALNPIFMFYAGIVWKDVMLTTMAMVATTCLLLSLRLLGWRRVVLLLAAALLTSALVLIRQQGVLLAVPLALAVAGLVVGGLRRGRLRRAAVFAGCLVGIACSTLLLDAASNKTITPQAKSPVSVGLLTIEAYDVVGMINYAKPGDTDAWAKVPVATKVAIQSGYSAQRIDTIWHVPAVRDYFNAMSAGQLTTTWMAGVRHDPMAYLKHRFAAFSYLLGLNSISGCVPAYWGVAGVPEQMTALDFREQMDSRARLIGRTAQQLYPSPVFRNWFYGVILLLSTAMLFWRTAGKQRWACAAVATSAWLYLGSFLPTTIACDVRYLYPVAGLSTLLAIYVLTQSTGIRHAKSTQSA